jgi:hypothetical protein
MRPFRKPYFDFGRNARTLDRQPPQNGTAGNVLKPPGDGQRGFMG